MYGELSELAVSIRDLTKAFGKSDKKPRALNNVSLDVRRGERVAIVGLNGSGKSTLIRVLATLTIPDSGTAHVFGFDVVRDSRVVRRHVNRVSVEASFFKEMSPWENLAYAARLYGYNGENTRERAIATMQRLGLPRTVVDKPMKHLSRGQQQKVAIARSMLTSPALLLMDEPTTGLDPRSKREVQSFVGNIHATTGATVVICTHDLVEAEALCDRVIVMDRGSILADAEPAVLRHEHGNVSLEDVFLKLTGKSFEDDTEEDENAEKEQPEPIGTSP